MEMLGRAAAFARDKACDRVPSLGAAMASWSTRKTRSQSAFQRMAEGLFWFASGEIDAPRLDSLSRWQSDLAALLNQLTSRATGGMQLR